MHEGDPVQDALPEIALRIPGLWEKPEDLLVALPPGYSMAPPSDPERHFARLMMPDGGSVEVNVLPADDEFAEVFASGCSRPPSEKDQQTIENYKVNVCLSGPGGSLEAAHRMLVAGAAIIRAGGAGVFIDNCGAAHGSDDWLALAGDPNNSRQGEWGGVFWAFVITFAGKEQVWSLGMHALGFRDAVIPATGDKEFDWHMITNFLGYSYRSGANIADGDLLGGEDGPQFRAIKEPMSLIPPGSPMHNPYGVWRLEHVQAEDNG